MIPKIQIALDNVSIEDALVDLRKVGDYVDIIEIGTVLHLTNGMLPLRIANKLYGKKKILFSDLKCTDAGKTLCEQSVENGAKQITVNCNADIETVQAMKKVADKNGAEVHVELYGTYSDETMEKWRNNGIKHCIYHRSRDSQLQGKKWSDNDLKNIQRLNDFGFMATLAGGLQVEDIKLFKELNIYCFIVGRSIRDAKDSKEATTEFKEEIKNCFNI